MSTVEENICIWTSLPASFTSSWTSSTFTSTPLILSLTLCVTFSSSADAMHAPSCVNLSNLSRLSSMSVFPVKSLIYCSKERCQSRLVSLRDLDSLNLPHFTSLVASARMVSTSTIISTIKSAIAVVGAMLVYISSRWKNRSMRLKMSTSWSWPELESLAA
jgi:hypothetical protein